VSNDTINIYNNCECGWCRFLGKRRYRSKKAKFLRPVRTQRTRMISLYHVVKEIDDVWTQYHDVTDGRTDRQREIPLSIARWITHHIKTYHHNCTQLSSCKITQHNRTYCMRAAVADQFLMPHLRAGRVQTEIVYSGQWKYPMTQTAGPPRRVRECYCLRAHARESPSGVRDGDNSFRSLSGRRRHWARFTASVARRSVLITQEFNIGAI